MTTMRSTGNDTIPIWHILPVTAGDDPSKDVITRLEVAAELWRLADLAWKQSDLPVEPSYTAVLMARNLFNCLLGVVPHLSVLPWHRQASYLWQVPQLMTEVRSILSEQTTS